MIRLLLACYPKAWRRTYGDEFAALLEETPLTPRVVLDVLAGAARLHVTVHRTRALIGAAVLVTVVVEVVAQVSGLAVNVLWAPTSPVRIIALLALIGPWGALVVRAARGRSRPPLRS